VTADIEADPVGAVPAGAPAPDTGAGRRLRPPAAETKRLYAADWGAFEASCDAAGQPALPAAAATSSAGACGRRGTSVHAPI
jgi:hypothetical protein